MPSDALISEWAESFIGRLTRENRTLWDSLFDEFLENPINESTVDYLEAGEADAKATEIGPFIVVFRFLNSETLAIASIRWGPSSPAGDPRLSERL